MTLTCVLFAGGESRRMGADKALLEINEESLWARQLKILRVLEPAALWISARTKPAWCPWEVETVLDEPPSRGPLSGLCTALKQLRTTHLLALAVDLPRMEAGHLKNLWGRAQLGSGVLPVKGDDCEPLCAIYPGGERVIRSAERALAGEDFSLQSFAGTLRQAGCMETFSLSEADRNFYLNANTPDDFEAAGL